MENECPKGERWICFTFALRSRVQDLVKSQIINKKKKPTQQSNSISNTLNPMIRLQTIAEMMTNRSSQALELILNQQSQTKTLMYQNKLALDYLLAKERSVCGKFNLSSC